MPYPKNKEGSQFWDIVKAQHQKELPFVVYRKPNEDQLYFMGQHCDTLVQTTQYTEIGFVFAPFKPGTPAVLLPPDIVAKTNFIAQNKTSTTLPTQAAPVPRAKEKHLQLIAKGIDHIRSGGLTKVVLARTITQPFSGDVFLLFQRIASRYPSALCYLWYHPKVGLWLGATPELLLKLNGHTFTTMSLAGTKNYMMGTLPSWGQKELQEQALVTDYILERLKSEVTDVVAGSLESVRAGNLWHLQTILKGNLKSNKIEEVLAALHPTPAICGVPKAAALHFILEQEPYDRAFYAGFLGELNFPSTKGNKTALYVNLRCLQLQNEEALLYVGGGITKDSIPEKEWEETVAKSKTLLQVLANPA
ncbi:chorismate-binding protein [Arenibacter sp. GZD96]|uniref:chorismate-binding protein n=1 Tax=Aurantibrevibacter litoralis TaxID=3106030 RepID=UPI002AFF74C9|nr:chorismate-binding protein [Arenibacter sp. GZD-96]MEA1786261.1 chorismate-binding protein [Arenibacter sp. GZD-96]